MTSNLSQASLSQFNPPSPRLNVIIFTTILHIAVLSAFLPSTFSWAAVGVAVLLHWMTIGLGIAFGFHRLATHRSLV
ncbi:MAG: acyl-CoA desaturase, partial [Cyanobacteria bacterium J06635_10]